MREATGGGGSSQGGLFTPPPGDPGAIRAAANQLKSHGTSVGDLAASARRTSTNLIATGDWEGPASDKYSTFSANLIGLASDAEEPAGTIAGGANQYADALDTLKRKLTDAASRHQTASARAENLRTTTNSNPNRTPAQVQAAQAEVNKLDDEAKAAEADARRAWAEYNHESEAAAKAIGQVGQSLKGATQDNPVRATLDAAEGEPGEESPDFWEYKEGLTPATLTWDFQSLGFKTAAYVMTKRGASEAGKLFGDAAETLEGGSLKNGLGNLVYLGEDAGPEAKIIAGGLKWGGRAFGALGVASSGTDFVHDLVNGDGGKATLDGIKTALSAGAMIPDPPGNIICGAGAAGIELYESVPAVHDAVNAVGSGISHAASKVGHVLSDLNPF